MANLPIKRTVERIPGGMMIAPLFVALHGAHRAVRAAA
jgi:hypothetical protein